MGLEPFSHSPPRVYGVHQAERIDFPCDNDEEQGQALLQRISMDLVYHR